MTHDEGEENFTAEDFQRIQEDTLEDEMKDKCICHEGIHNGKEFDCACEEDD